MLTIRPTLNLYKYTGGWDHHDEQANINGNCVGLLRTDNTILTMLVGTASAIPMTTTLQRPVPMLLKNHQAVVGKLRK